MWTAGTEARERAAFVDALLAMLDDGLLSCAVLVVRGDYLGRLAEHAELAGRTADGLVLVPPMTEPELREVVEEPARAAGLDVDPDLVDAVIRDMHGQSAALPLLSSALVGTWERRRDGMLTLTGYVRPAASPARWRAPPRLPWRHWTPPTGRWRAGYSSGWPRQAARTTRPRSYAGASRSPSSASRTPTARGGAP